MKLMLRTHDRIAMTVELKECLQCPVFTVEVAAVREGPT